MIKSRKGCPFQYVEIMACPGGCNNGGGQIKPDENQTVMELLSKVEESYHSELIKEEPIENKTIQNLYNEWCNTPKRKEKLLYTNYHEISNLDQEIAAAIQW